jgi:hypothetical protein
MSRKQAPMKKGENVRGRSTVQKVEKATPKNADSPFHVLLRVRSENGQTIDAHTEIIRRKGTALLAKMGEPIGPDFINKLNEQIGRKVKTFLFLTLREGWNGPYVTYRCSLHQVSNTVPPNKHSLIPGYYGFVEAAASTWFEISSMERMTRDEMNRIFVLSSGRSIMSVIASSATVFRVALQ